MGKKVIGIIMHKRKSCFRNALKRSLIPGLYVPLGVIVVVMYFIDSSTYYHYNTCIFMLIVWSWYVTKSLIQVDLSLACERETCIATKNSCVK